ncbi:hypothetical protein POJ06DRAFT_298087 [Lipomyces tetrasporus]|uniref:Uncharacterized protein n=1 Tax=Lipomyces tetrasporus TaxID=54092 RepID=A0AAD7VVK8_9ASCO|nr:uncharacterized protein POJ06DRAFT_298087 [Lipomyces tetrasporus]KAJ8103598.1 hypothetical protein POJ06DRAFT_298087 [Lipomyces tetrasporus]
MGKIDTATTLYAWQVERRKCQNAAAQRRRRHRRKKDHILHSAIEHGLLSTSGSHHWHISAAGVSITSLEFTSAMFDSLGSDSERANIALIMAVENLSMRDVVKYGLIALGYAMYPEHYSNAEVLPSETWIERILFTINRQVNVMELVTAGVKTLVQLDGPKEWSGYLSLMTSTAEGERYFTTPPDLVRNAILPSNISFFAACLANCHLLGLAPDDFMKDDTISPFVLRRQKVPDDGADSDQLPGSETTASPSIPYQSHGSRNDMDPTVEQLTISHHPYLDVIPWPSFRARAIIASSMDPPLIDEADLCLDLIMEFIVGA